MLERLNLAVFQFNLWINEFLNLHCAKYDAENGANTIQADMRHVYAMHLHFLARATTEEIWQFYCTHRTDQDKKQWAMHMLRVQEALMISKGKKLPDDHEVLCGTEENPITRGSARDVTDYIQYYMQHHRFVDTCLFMRKMAAVQKNLQDPDSVQLSAEDSVNAEAWYANGQIAPVGLMDALLAAVENNENAVDATFSWDGQVVSVRTATDMVNRANRQYLSEPPSAAGRTRARTARGSGSVAPGRQTRG